MDRHQQDLGKAGRTLAGALTRLARERRDVRDALHTLHDWLGGMLGSHAQAEVRAAGSGERPAAHVDGRRAPASGDATGFKSCVDLSQVIRRARWKAAACRLAVDRRRAEEKGDGITPELRRIEEGLRSKRERLEDCYPWMLESSRPFPNEETATQVGACYDTVALAAELTAKLLGEGLLEPSPPAELLYLLAEAQSALLASLDRADQRNDSDQRDLFLWLKEQTTRHRIYVDRHMRLDDPADPSASADLGARLRALADGLRRETRARVERGQLINKMRFHVKKMVEAGASTEGDWDSLLSAVNRWLELGFSATDRTLHELLEPFAEELASGKELPEAVKRVLSTEIQPLRHEGGHGEGEARALVQAAELLEGRVVALFVGGEPDEESPNGASPTSGETPGESLGEAQREDLRASLGLAELRCLELDPEHVQAALEAAIPSDDIDLVMIATRLPVEAYGEFKRLCMEHDKPFVRLPGGLDPGPVAHQVMRQVGWRLRNRKPQSL